MTLNAHSRDILRQLRADGVLRGGQPLDEEATERLLKTPPSLLLRRPLGADPPALAEGGGKKAAVVDAPRTAVSASVARATMDALQVACEGFHATVDANTRLAAEAMKKALLQLIEDILSERLPELLGRKNLSGIGGRREGTSAISRRPVDRGLDRADAFAVVIPDGLRKHIAGEMSSIIERELRRALGPARTDMDGVLSHAQALHQYVLQLEEEALQHNVEAQHGRAEIAEIGQQFAELTTRHKALERDSDRKDRQMDVLREQLQRRSAQIDESRVAFRKEAQRLRMRLLEVEMELEQSRGIRSKKAGLNASLEVERDELPSLTALDAIATDGAVQAAVARCHDEHKQRESVWHREKRQLMMEHQLQLAERNAEIARLREKSGTSPLMSSPNLTRREDEEPSVSAL